MNFSIKPIESRALPERLAPRDNLQFALSDFRTLDHDELYPS